MATTHPHAHLYFKQKAITASLRTAVRCSQWLPEGPYDLPIQLGTGEVKMMTIGEVQPAQPKRDFGDGIAGPPSSKRHGADARERTGGRPPQPCVRAHVLLGGRIGRALDRRPRALAHPTPRRFSPSSAVAHFVGAKLEPQLHSTVASASTQ